MECPGCLPWVGMEAPQFQRVPHSFPGDTGLAPTPAEVRPGAERRWGLPGVDEPGTEIGAEVFKDGTAALCPRPGASPGGKQGSTEDLGEERLDVGMCSACWQHKERRWRVPGRSAGGAVSLRAQGQLTWVPSKVMRLPVLLPPLGLGGWLHPTDPLSPPGR